METKCFGETLRKRRLEQQAALQQSYYLIKLRLQLLSKAVGYGTRLIKLYS
jgi:hypothetical protein